MLPDQVAQRLVDGILCQLDLDDITHLREFLKKLVQGWDLDTLSAVGEGLAIVV
jgi:hypothetical protein